MNGARCPVVEHAPQTLEGGLVWAALESAGCWRSEGLGGARVDRGVLAGRLGDAVTADDLDALVDALEAGASAAQRARGAEERERRGR